MSGNRDELPEPTDGPEGSSRSQQRRARDEIAEELGIDPSLVATRDTLDEGIERRLSDEGATAAERQLRQETAADREFVQPADLRANVDRETFARSATLTEEGRQRAQQRQAEQLRQQAASQSDRFGEGDFRVDRSGEAVAVEPTEEAVDRERREAAADQFEGQSQFINNVEPADVSLTDDSAELSDQIIDRAEQRAQRQARQQASQQRQQARRDFAQSIESGSAFGDLPDGVDPESLVGDVDPQQDIVAEDGSLTLADDVQARINSQLESDALQQQRREFASALESGEAFESGEAPEGLGDVDPQTDIAIEDDQLTLADETQRELVTSQLPDSATSVRNPDELVSGVVDEAAERAAQSKAAREALEEKYPDGVEVIGTAGFGTGEVGATRLDFSGASAETRQQFDLDMVSGDLSNVTPDDFTNPAEGRDISKQISVSGNDALNQQFRAEAAAVVDEQLPGQQQLSADDIAADGSIEGELPSLRIDSDEITDSGITEGGRDDLAQQQLTRIEEQSPTISATTPTDSQAFANTVAELGRELDDPSLTARQDVFADLPFGSGDINITSATELVSQIDPQEAARNEDIDLTAGQIRQAQQDIEAQQQQLQNDPSAVLDEVAADPDDFIERATLLNTQNRQGRARRSAAREQINAIEEDLGADANLQLSSDAQGIGGINEAARDAIQARAAEPLPNFGDGDINVGIDDGTIETNIDQSVLRRTQRNAIEIDEQQARNQIADQTAAVDRGEIEVDGGDVGLSQEGVEQLRIDAVDGETGRGEITADLNAQTPGVDLDVGDVRLQQTAAGGVSVGLSEFGRTRLNTDRPSIDEMLSQSTAAGGFDGQGQVVEPAADPEENFGDAVPDSIEDTTRQIQQETGQVVDGAAAFVGNVSQPAGTAVENTLTGLQDITGGDVSAIESNARAANETVTNTAEGVTSGLLFPVRAAGSAPQLGVEATEFGIEAATDPVETAEKIPGAIGERVDRSITGLQQKPVQTSAELVGSFASSSAVFRAAQGTRAGPAVRATMQPGEELFKAAGRRGITGSRRVANIISNPNFASEDRGQTSPLLGLEGRSESDSGGLLDNLEDDLNNVESTSPEVDEGQTSFRPEFDRESDIDAGDPVNRRVEVRQRSVDDRSRDRAFRRSLQDEPTTPDVDVDVGSDLLAGGVGSTIDAIEPQVDADETVQSTDVTANDATTAGTVGADLGGVDSQFEQSIGETGQQRFFERAEPNVQGEQIDSVGVTPGTETGFDARPRDRTRPGFETDLRTGLETGTETAQEPRQETRTGFETETRTEPGIETAFETEPGIESEPGIETTFEPGSEIDPPEPVPEAEPRDEEQGFGLQSSDDLFDSEILSGEEALEQTFGSDSGRDDRFTL